MWEDVAITLGLKAVAKFFDSLGQPDTPPVAIGLAVGYHYSFLVPVAEAVERGTLTLYSDAEGGGGRTFPEERVRVQLLVPGALTPECIRRSEEAFAAAHRGWIQLATHKRYYGVNYTLTELPTGAELTFVDLVRPLLAVRRYYEEIVRLATDDRSEKWRRTQAAEIAAFKETLRELRRRGAGAQVGRLDFRECA